MKVPDFQPKTFNRLRSIPGWFYDILEETLLAENVWWTLRTLWTNQKLDDVQIQGSYCTLTFPTKIKVLEFQESSTTRALSSCVLSQVTDLRPEWKMITQLPRELELVHLLCYFPVFLQHYIYVCLMLLFCFQVSLFLKLNVYFILITDIVIIIPHYSLCGLMVWKDFTKVISGARKVFSNIVTAVDRHVWIS